MNFNTLLLLFYTIYFTNSIPQPMYLNQILNRYLPSNQTHQYQLQLTQQPAIKDLYFVGQASQPDPFNIPNLIIKNGILAWACTRDKGTDICIIPNLRIHQNDKFQINVYCPNGCNYTLQAYLAEQYQIQLQKQYTLNFQYGYALIYSLQIPKDLEFSMVYIVANVINLLQISQSIIIYANIIAADELNNTNNQANKPSPQNHQLISLSTWEDGQGIFIEKDKLNGGDKIKLFVYSPPLGKIKLSIYSTFGNTRNISLFKQVKDYIATNQQKIYIVDIQSVDLSKQNIYLRLNKFAGEVYLHLSSNQKFQNQTSKDILVYQAVTQTIIDDKQKKQLNITNTLYIKITGVYDAVYDFQLFTNTKQFVILKQAATEVAYVQNGQIQNYILQKTYKLNPKDKTIMNFEVKIQVYASNLTFGVKRCQQLQKPMAQKSLSCLIKSKQQYTQAYQDFQKIKGQVTIYNNVQFFNFPYDIKKCRFELNQSYIYTYKCVFQIVAYSESPTSIYTISIQQKDAEIYLNQGIPKKQKLLQSQYKFYKLQFPILQQLQQVRVHLTIINGNCVIIGSFLQAFPRFGDQNITVSGFNNLIFKEGLKNTLYLSVYASEQSLYSITASVKKRNNQFSMILLHEGTLETMRMQSGNYQKFYIKLEQSKNFTIQFNIIQGSLWFEVYPAQNKIIKSAQQKWNGLNYSIQITNETGFYTPSLEFILIIHIVQNSAFSLKYKIQTKCYSQSIGIPLFLELQKNQKICLKYHLSKLQDFQIVLSTASYIFIKQSFLINYKINQTKTQIINRLSTITKQQLLSICPQFQKSNTSPIDNQTNCDIEIQFVPQNKQRFILTVQYIEDNIFLYDGLLQHVEAKMSKTVPKYFYFYPSSDQTISIIIKSKTNTKYNLIAKIVYADDQKLISKSQNIFPKFDQPNANNIFRGQTSSFFVTSLIIQKSDLQKLTQKDFSIVLSVFTLFQSLQEVNFKIQVNQRYSKVQIGQTKIGYVDKDSTRRYQFSLPQKQEALVSLNGLTRKCATLNIYEKTMSTSITQSIPIETSQQGHIIIQSYNQTKFYVAEVLGQSSCSYQISFADIKYRTYQVFESIPMQFDLKQNQSIYFLYYHTKNESFRFLAMVQYGDVDLYAQTLTDNQLASIQTHIQNQQNEVMFQGKQIGTLEISNTNKDYCTKCYYLIEAKPSNKSSITFLLHTQNSPIPVQDNKFLRDKLSINDTIQYIFHSISTFNITIDVLYGNPSIKVIKAGNNQILNQKIQKKSQKFTIPHSLENQADYIGFYDKQSQFKIIVSGDNLTETIFIISVRCHGNSIRIKRGLPFTIQLIQNIETQIQFISHSSKDLQYLTIELDGKSDNLEYNLVCESQIQNVSCTNLSNLIFTKQKSQSNLLLQLFSFDGTYFLTLKSKVNMSIILMVANTQIKHLQMNSQILVKTNITKSQVFQIYSPINGSIMIQAFQCRGQIDISAGKDYNNLLSNNGQLLFQHTKTGGHYVGKAQIQSGLYFFLAKSRIIKQNDTSLYLTKYSFYQKNEFPYQQFEMSNQQVSFKNQNNKFIFMVDKIIQLGGKFNIINIYYTLYLSACHMQIVSATQCQSNNNSLYNITREFGQNIQKINNTIEFEVDSDQIEKIVSKNQYFYVGVVGTIEIIPKLAHHNDQYRFIYDLIQMSKVKLVNTGPKRTWFDFFMWTILPISVGLIVLVLSLRFCVRKVYYLPDNNLNQQEMKEVPNQSGNIDNASGVISGVINDPNKLKQQV